MSEQPNEPTPVVSPSVVSPELIAIQKEMAELRAAVAEFNEASAEISRDVRQREQEIADLKAKNQAIKDQAFGFHKKMRDAEKKFADAIKIEEQKEENLRVEREFAALSDELDKITADCKWFGKALKHQTTGAKRMAIAKRGLIADKMGLGKSLTALMTCDMLKAKRILIVTKADLVGNFNDEVKRWTDRGAVPIVGMNKPTRDVILKHLAEAPEFMVIINYEAWRKDKELLQGLIDLQFDTMIIDEAHTIKNIKTASYRGVKAIVFAKNKCPLCGSRVEVSTDDYGAERPFCVNKCDVSALEEMEVREKNTAQYLYCSVKNVFPMTGTFILNRPQEIFASLSLVSPQRFHSLNSFLNRYCAQDWNTGKWRFRSGGVASLMKALEGNIIARDLKSAGIELPPQTVTIHNLTLDPDLYPDQFKVMDELKRFNAIDLRNGDDGENIGIFHLLALITRERQAVTWPAGMRFVSADATEVYQCEVSESVKIDAILKYDPEENEWDGILPVATMVGERDEVSEEWLGDRVAVFSQFKTPLIEIERRCREAGISVVRLDGDTDDYTKTQIRKDFNRSAIADDPGYIPKWQVVLCNYKSGGVGLNFTDVTQTIVLDEEWNPGSRDQAYARTYRMGQTEETTVHVLRLENSIDQWMAQLMEMKEALVAGFESDIELADALRDILEKK